MKVYFVSFSYVALFIYSSEAAMLELLKYLPLDLVAVAMLVCCYFRLSKSSSAISSYSISNESSDVMFSSYLSAFSFGLRSNLMTGVSLTVF